MQILTLLLSDIVNVLVIEFTGCLISLSGNPPKRPFGAFREMTRMVVAVSANWFRFRETGSIGDKPRSGPPKTSR